ncbi:unnamed protein product [Aureobasidium mustum]|uniref:F-box domain-containing protein n=1 Tax=Aureobasidium mustum TaxID=2773714 RepID=A0A9N8PKD0_9PEZI|nr:unnamed protein product [Aureobasidium mustum]
MLVCRDWAEIASNIWWETRRYIGPQAEDPLASLARLPLKRQQWYANKIHHLNLNETNASDFIAALELNFPSLRTLKVTQWSHHKIGFVCLASQFIGRGLLELKLLRTYLTDDILTALLNAPNLRTLELWCQSPDATSSQLLNVTKACSQLRVLELTWTIEALINKDVLAAIASLVYLKELRLPRYEITSAVSNYVLATNTFPLRSITRLDLGGLHSTAIDLLSGIPTLRSLSLGVIDTTPILQTLATLCNLEDLDLRFRDAVAIGYSQWKFLMGLRDLRSIKISSWNGFGFSQVDLSSITTGEFISFFRAMPQLSRFWVNATISNTAQLYIKAGEICKGLKSLGLRGQYDSTMILESHTGDGLLYPMLESLWVHQFIEPQGEHTWDERVDSAALLLHKAAPKLWVLLGGTQTDRQFDDDASGHFVIERDHFTACVKARHGSVREQERTKYLDEKYGKNRRSGMPIGTYV